jgi:hypothetical protein
MHINKKFLVAPLAALTVALTPAVASAHSWTVPIWKGRAAITRYGNTINAGLNPPGYLTVYACRRSPGHFAKSPRVAGDVVCMMEFDLDYGGVCTEPAVASWPSRWARQPSVYASSNDLICQ